MQKLIEVEEAKALMIEASEWSVVRWLREKKRVRRTADKANAALDRLEQEIKVGWSDDLQAAYRAVAPQSGNTPGAEARRRPMPNAGDSQLLLLARKVREADDAAYRAHMDAEATFDEAERQLSTRLAREGCRKAIDSWDLHEKAIRRAEAAISPNR